MIHFDCDYMDAAHPLILKTMYQRYNEKNQTYGTDEYCKRAADKIRELCSNTELEVDFLVGGTQTNATVIDALLRPYEGVIAVESAHINVHEAGAIEFGGHKVLALPHKDGKLTAKTLEDYLYTFHEDPTKAHMVQPGMVYISQPTEYGTLYSLSELQDLSELCHRYHIPLYVDGARLAYALASPQNDISLKELATYCDTFYFGGTKVGTLFGEAVVYRKGLIPHFFTYKKMHGGLLAKGWLLGMQFECLFTDQLYLQNAQNAIDKAIQIKEAFLVKGYELYFDSPTNQQFILIEDTTIQRLEKEFLFNVWGRYDETRSIVRFVTTWSTSQEDVDSLVKAI